MSGRALVGHLRAAALAIMMPFGLLLIFCAMVPALPYLIWSERRRALRMRRVVAGWPCGWCVAPLGVGALARADAVYAGCAAAAPERLSRRRVRTLHACCQRCDAAHRFDGHAFALEPRVEAVAMYGDALRRAVPPPTATLSWPWAPPDGPLHAIALTRDSVAQTDDGDAPHHGSIAVPAAADVTAMAEALLRSAWLPRLSTDAGWHYVARGVAVELGMRADMPFVIRDGMEPMRAEAVSAIHLACSRHGATGR